MDRIRTLLLARTHVVVMDPDLIAGASTRPSRDADVDKLEDDLARLGFVMSLDLASTLRRLPHQAFQDLRGWICDTLASHVGPQPPQVPLARAPTTTSPGDAPARYVQRMLSWLATTTRQPCPWCGEIRGVGALDPCGHLVCHVCWTGSGFSSCPVCHRRVALGDPFLSPAPGSERVGNHPGTLTLLHLGFDLLGTARQRFERLVTRTTPLSPADREEVEALIDAVGPRIAAWLPPVIPRRETMAIAIARLWLVSPDRSAMLAETAQHVTTATDVARVATVLMGGPPTLTPATKLSSLARGLRRCVLEALERLPLEEVVEGMMRHRRLWKRVGERLHPFEHGAKLPNTALAFAVVRGSKLSELALGPGLRERAVRMAFVYVEDEMIKPIAWAGPIEDALRAGNPRSALARLTHRPSELLRRADQLVRIAQTRQLDALQTILKAIELAGTKAPPAAMLTVAGHVARRARPSPRRVFFPAGQVLRAWTIADRRPPLRGDAIAVIVGSMRRQLCNRAELGRHFPRAVIDRALVDVAVPVGDSPSPRVAWPRGSEVALPEGQLLRLFVHWEELTPAHVDLDLSVVFYDAEWQHVATCDARTPVVAGRNDGRAAVHGGDVANGAPPFGGTELVDLHIEQLAMLGVRHAVVTLFNPRAFAYERLPHAFISVVRAPADGAPFEPRTAPQRFDLRGRSPLTVPLALDLGERQLRWLDVRVDRAELDLGYRATLAHIGRDFTAVIATHARPTMWDVAAIHAAARANVVYIRERDGSFTMYRRRDNESKLARLGRVMSGAADDGRTRALPTAAAPTWFAVVSGLPLPPGSTGYALDGRGLPATGVERQSAAELVAELAARRRA